MEKDSCDADWVIRSYLSRFEIVPERSNPSDWIEKDDNGTWYRYAVDLLVPDRNLMELLVVGIAAIDIIHEVAQYPEEDSKIRALASRKARGGNATNTLVICAQLGIPCGWMGTSTDPATDTDAKFIFDELKRYHINTSACYLYQKGSMPISYILLSQATGSRTITHSRNLPELPSEAFIHNIEPLLQASSPLRWIHFEGRNLENLPTILSFLNQQQKSLTISIEFEAIRHPWNTLKQFLQFVSYVFISKDYVKKQIRYTSALDFLQAVVNMEYPEFLSSPTLQVIICPWGKEGVYYLDLRKEIFEKKPVLVAPSKVVQVVESMGAGDTFIGAFLSSLLRGHSVDEACIFANQVAVAKCTQRGFEFSSEQIVTWTSKLK